MVPISLASRTPYGSNVCTQYSMLKFLFCKMDRQAASWPDKHDWSHRTTWYCVVKYQQSWNFCLKMVLKFMTLNICCKFPHKCTLGGRGGGEGRRGERWAKGENWDDMWRIIKVILGWWVKHTYIGKHTTNASTHVHWTLKQIKHNGQQ